MGPVPAQPRRARPRPPDQGAARDGVQGVRPDKNMQLYDRGIRRRLAPMLGGDRRRIELAYSLMFTLPGTPVIRYGDELGMGDDLDLPERKCARTPMQWSTEPHAGFTKSDKPCLPVIDKGPYGYRARQCRQAAARSEFDAELDRAHHPHAQGGAGDRLGRFQGDRGARSRRARSCATTGATIPCCSSTISTRTARDLVRGRASRRGRQAAGQSVDGGSQPGRRARQAQRRARSLWLSLVSRRRPRLSAQAQRHRTDATASASRRIASHFRRWIAVQARSRG